MSQDVFSSIDREIRHSLKQEKLRKQAQWNKEHPRLHAMKTGWGTAVKKEGRALGRQLAHEGRSLVNDFDRELGKLFRF